MPRSRHLYPPEFLQQIIELAQAGRAPEELPQEFEPTTQIIHNTGSPSSQRYQGQPQDGLTTPERAALRP